MVKHYRLIVSYNRRAWCHIDSNVPWIDEVLEDIQTRFPSDAGYHIEILVATDEHRIVEYTSQGPRLLMSEPTFY
ncbi:hypothetical protein Thini_1033 [Thiothrix nivea DSM 5205]|uniref:Cytoplasmic protein n=1 Tax=Thiothrix nivea (strain ATCC 35100 / DSM 5205 / JP2) TaxID=870187 RepID=A0A656HBD3_THINJ|nr:hypothetical protein Thini_1033 [Thiothrix nivea DSM 5205]